MGGAIPIENVDYPHPHNRRRAPIAVSHPHLTAEWLYSKNCGFGPEDFSYGSDVAPWWRCAINKKHIWQTSICLRASRGHQCPFCVSRRLAPENTLAKKYPKIAKQWHPSRNKELQPTDVYPNSTQIAWWLCQSCSYEWQAKIANRTSCGDKCYRCARNVLDLRNYPHALAHFDKKRNSGLDPTWLAMRMKIHWRCSKGKDHLWCQSFTKKCKEENFCPFCSNRLLSKTNCLAKLYPKLAPEWHPKRNGKLTPTDVIATSGTKVWWLCSECNHSFTTRVNDRSALGHGCPECWKVRRSETMKQACAKLRTPPKIEATVLKLFKQGISKCEIARRLKLGRNTVYRIVDRRKAS